MDHQRSSGKLVKYALACLVVLVGAVSVSADIWSEAEHGYVNNEGVKIHYATTGSGPLVVMIHGFPDFWYTWRHQMAGLKGDYQLVAIDQRGYNLSDKPKGDENYDMRLLVSDVAAVIAHFDQKKAVIVGHDWGGVVAWNFAFALPQMVDKLIILNLPHPNGLARVTRQSDSARKNTHYAQIFRNGTPEDPHIFFGGPMTPQTMAGWVTDKDARKRYVNAFEQSDFDAMLAYYKRNYPPAPKKGAPLPPLTPKLKMPVLIFHGLADLALPSDALNNTWDWIDADLTLVTAPGAQHFVQQDAAELVTDTMKWWLKARE